MHRSRFAALPQHRARPHSRRRLTREWRRIGAADNLVRSGGDQQTAVCRRRCDALVQWRPDIAYGLNVVETLRQKDGLSGTLYNVPMIIGPSSFAVLTSTETGSQVQSAGSDFGTNHITWGTLNQTLWIGAARAVRNLSTTAHSATGCARVTPIPDPATASRRSFVVVQPADLRRRLEPTGMADRRPFQRVARHWSLSVGKAIRWALPTSRCSR